jgi:hypothetical protein
MALAGSEKNEQAGSPSMKRAGGFTLPPLRRTNGLEAKFALVLVYAPARWGKTRLIKTARNPLILANEIGEMRGLGTLADVDIPFIPIDTVAEMTHVLAELGKRGDHVEYEGYTPDWVILDSLSNMGYIWYDKALDVHDVDMAWDPTETKDPRKIYPYVAEKGRHHIKRLLDLPCNVCIIAREKVIEEQVGKDKYIHYAPELPGQQLGKEIPGWPDATLHGVVRMGKSLLQTRKADGGKTIAGIRLPESLTCPEFILPNLEDIKALMVGSMDTRREALVRLTPKKADAT